MDPHSSVTTEAIKPKQKISPTSPIYIDEKNKDTSPLKSTNLHAQFVDKKYHALNLLHLLFYNILILTTLF